MLPTPFRSWWRIRNFSRLFAASASPLISSGLAICQRRRVLLFLCPVIYIGYLRQIIEYNISHCEYNELGPSGFQREPLYCNYCETYLLILFRRQWTDVLSNLVSIKFWILRFIYFLYVCNWRDRRVDWPKRYVLFWK